MTFEALDDATGAQSGLGDLLVDEHVLVPVPGGFRFAFDLAGEFLAARGLDPAEAADALANVYSERQIGESPTGAYVFALLEFERTGRAVSSLRRWST